MTGQVVAGEEGRAAGRRSRSWRPPCTWTRRSRCTACGWRCCEADRQDRGAAAAAALAVTAAREARGGAAGAGGRHPGSIGRRGVGAGGARGGLRPRPSVSPIRRSISPMATSRTRRWRRGLAAHALLAEPRLAAGGGVGGRRRTRCSAMPWRRCRRWPGVDPGWFRPSMALLAAAPQPAASPGPPSQPGPGHRRRRVHAVDVKAAPVSPPRLWPGHAGRWWRCARKPAAGARPCRPRRRRNDGLWRRGAWHLQSECGIPVFASSGKAYPRLAASDLRRKCGKPCGKGLPGEAEDAMRQRFDAL